MPYQMPDDLKKRMDYENASFSEKAKMDPAEAARECQRNVVWAMLNVAKVPHDEMRVYLARVAAKIEDLSRVLDIAKSEAVKDALERANM